MNHRPQIGENDGIAIIESYNNTSQKTIKITEDRLRLRLLEHVDKLTTNQAWQVPLGLLLTIVLVFCTAEFKPVVLSANTWEAIFIIGGIACFIWLVASLTKLSKAPSLDDLIAAIKKTED